VGLDFLAPPFASRQKVEKAMANQKDSSYKRLFTNSINPKQNPTNPRANKQLPLTSGQSPMRTANSFFTIYISKAK
jgi:hypothetical protein